MMVASAATITRTSIVGMCLMLSRNVISVVIAIIIIITLMLASLGMLNLSPLLIINMILMHALRLIVHNKSVSIMLFDIRLGCLLSHHLCIIITILMIIVKGRIVFLALIILVFPLVRVALVVMSAALRGRS